MKKIIILGSILGLTLLVSFGLPKTKYKSPDILSKLEIPARTENWRSKDISTQLNLGDERYNFISEIYARAYTNYYGETVLWLILDAGNFHNPKVCFGSSGFTIEELPDLEIKLPHRTLKAKMLYTGKPKEGYLLIYWITINKNIVDWTQQKILQLWYALFNKEKIGLMVRFDIPTSRDRIENAQKIAQELLVEVLPQIPPDQAEYIFGAPQK